MQYMLPNFAEFFIKKTINGTLQAIAVGKSVVFGVDVGACCGKIWTGTIK